MLVGASVATIGLAGLGGASVFAVSSGDSGSSIVDKIASTFGLDKAKVQAVFDQDRASHMADMQTKRAAALKQAVTDGKLTQTQADYITNAWKDIDSLRQSGGSPGQESTTTRDAIKAKMDALQAWLKSQNLDLSKISGLGPMGRPGHGPHMDNHGDADDTSTQSTSTNQ